MAQESPETQVKVLGLLVVLLLVGVALLIIRDLQHSDELQDCLMQGRSNCSPPIATGN